MLAASVLVLLTLGASNATAEAPASKRPQRTVPTAAEPGSRNHVPLAKSLGACVRAQPYAKTHAELSVAPSPAPDQTGMGSAKTHVHLGDDAIELQGQVQYLENTKVQGRFGAVLARCVRVFRYGRLAATRLVFESTKASRAQYSKDIKELANLWSKPRTSLGLAETFRVTKNTLGEAGPLPGEVHLEFEPRRGGTR